MILGQTPIKLQNILGIIELERVQDDRAVHYSLFQGKLAAGANLCLLKEKDNSLLFKTIESHLGYRGNSP